MNTAQAHHQVVSTTQRRIQPLLRTVMTHPTTRVVLRTLYYLAILVGLLVLYGRGDFSTPPFIYQGF